MDRYKKAMEIYNLERAQKVKLQSASVQQNLDGGPSQGKRLKRELQDEPSAGEKKSGTDQLSIGQGLQGMGMIINEMQLPALSQQEYHLMQQELLLQQQSQNPWSADLLSDGFPSSDTAHNSVQHQYQMQQFDHSGSNALLGTPMTSTLPSMGNSFVQMPQASFPSDPMSFYNTTGGMFPNQPHQPQQFADVTFPGVMFQEDPFITTNDRAFAQQPQQQQQYASSQFMPAMSGGNLTAQSISTIPTSFDSSVFIQTLGGSSSYDGLPPSFTGPKTEDE
jgi:hypothetical protein